MTSIPEINIEFGDLGAAPVSSQLTPARTINGRPYHAKRPHKKSRAGCVNCKSRKVKCNEERPRCRACTLRKETCVYPSTQHTFSAASSASSRSVRAAALSAAAAATATAAAAAPASSSSASNSLLPPSSTSSSSSSEDGSAAVASRVNSRSASPYLYSSTSDSANVERGWNASSNGPVRKQNRGGFNMLEEPFYLPPQIDQTDMKLLWFYTAKGFDAFAAEAGHQPQVDEILRVAIPRHAFSSRFLMDCLLALSALELQILNQPIEPSRVLMYRARAFAGYRKAIEEATPDTYPALLACSLLLCSLSSEMFRDTDSTALYILDWMVVWRGIGLIVKLIKPEMLFKSGMSLLFARPPINLDASTKYIPNQLLFMVSSIRHDEPDYMHINMYYETLKYLGSLYRELESGMGRILSLRTITWFTFLPKGFVDVAREHRPRALIILAHYLVFIKLCRLWWMQGIADKEIKDIRDVLDEDWLLFISGPLAALETDDEISIGKILLNNNSWQPDFFYDQTRDNQLRSLGLVDNSGRNIIFNGSWIQADTGKPAVWNMTEPLDTSSAIFRPEEIIGLRHLSLNIPGESPSAKETTGDGIDITNINP
ncbi:hypothetical protein SPBR_03674 [Sporothrix brasiliensis 5110]|uniref:Zn(2)-C6 fungal-type domain-containing protein n=1 Tax=Sporothrix brasiliensis 5110 TaxID=1398154 RepID=A0A0C2FVB8_9PEZI|nr:uncharacterized protein SPBR_03674 [Sporothrix brasiliensis 5110]KIH94988.1 hypothetical protein SPBR_03674 [Sporothrix brasiliensis 5110]